MGNSAMAVLDDDVDVFRQKQESTQYRIPDDAPVLPSLASTCECELVVKDDGTAMVFFTKQPPEDIHWIEYDMDLALLTFVTWSGKIFGLGMQVHKPFRKYLSQANELYMVYMENGTTPRCITSAKLVVRNIGL
jgi:hypothetical protein